MESACFVVNNTINMFIVLVVISAASECNETLGILPCFQGSCYYAEQQCDGERQCEDGADELGCECLVVLIMNV